MDSYALFSERLAFLMSITYLLPYNFDNLCPYRIMLIEQWPLRTATAHLLLS